jgi:3-hydroxyacyl-CoA dehydrogenase
MGRGIALVLLQSLGGDPDFHLILMDVDATLYPGVETYLRTHMRKHPLGEDPCDRVRYATSLEECAPVDIAIEAVVEDLDKKSALLKDAARQWGPETLFFTNTSSIPIHLLAEASGLTGRMVGFHFYNPPPVQKLVELILPEGAPESLRNLSAGIVQRLHKTAVYSRDVVGFIGNGHFIREVVAAWEDVERLSTRSEAEAVVSVNMVYEDWLLRPMGIFQLVDYVGIDVCSSIMKVMKKHVPDETLQCPYLEQLLSQGIRGGQNSDGTQKPGIFEYVEGKPVRVYSLVEKKYVPYEQELVGFPPMVGISWKGLLKDSERPTKLAAFFAAIAADKSLGASLALDLLGSSQAIAHKLVDTGVAATIADVDIVLQQGFYHLYGCDQFVPESFPL